ncbi:MAG: hypothetical protein AAF828_07725 [Bacteroidota bacterium]
MITLENDTAVDYIQKMVFPIDPMLPSENRLLDLDCFHEFWIENRIPCATFRSLLSPGSDSGKQGFVNCDLLHMAIPLGMQRISYTRGKGQTWQVHPVGNRMVDFKDNRKHARALALILDKVTYQEPQSPVSPTPPDYLYGKHFPDGQGEFGARHVGTLRPCLSPLSCNDDAFEPVFTRMISTSGEEWKYEDPDGNVTKSFHTQVLFSGDRMRTVFDYDFLVTVMPNRGICYLAFDRGNPPESILHPGVFGVSELVYLDGPDIFVGKL